MAGSDVLDAQFREAVAFLDAGDAAGLARCLEANPKLAGERLRHPGAWLTDKIGQAAKGFFKDPFLLWFVAEDPVRAGTLPANIAEIAQVIIAAARRARPRGMAKQLDYALSLVAWSWIAARCGVQLALLDVLLDAGAASKGGPENALVNGHEAAAAHLVSRGVPLTLATALCLGRLDEARVLAAKAPAREKQFALVLAALNGKAAGVAEALALGADLNRATRSLYSHGRPVHHAVCSSDLPTVRVLVEAGADLTVRDTVHGGTPLGWADYYIRTGDDAAKRERYETIAAYLTSRGATE